MKLLPTKLLFYFSPNTLLTEPTLVFNDSPNFKLPRCYFSAIPISPNVFKPKRHKNVDTDKTVDSIGIYV